MYHKDLAKWKSVEIELVRPKRDEFWQWQEVTRSHAVHLLPHPVPSADHLPTLCHLPLVQHRPDKRSAHGPTLIQCFGRQHSRLSIHPRDATIRSIPARGVGRDSIQPSAFTFTPSVFSKYRQRSSRPSTVLSPRGRFTALNAGWSVLVISREKVPVSGTMERSLCCALTEVKAMLFLSKFV